MRHCADVILVGVGDENPLQLIGAFRQPTDVGHDQIHAGGGVHVGKGHAQINQDQAFLARRAIAIEGVHADFTCPAEGQID